MNLNQANSIEYVYLNGEKISIKVVIGNTIYGIPLDEANTDYQAIQEWIANGGEVIDNGAE